MKILRREDLVSGTGKTFCIYADTGIGKSITSIQTAPDPIMFIVGENRSPSDWVEISGRNDVKIHFAFYESFEDTVETLCNVEMFDKYATIVIDGISYIMNVSLSSEIIDDRLGSRDKNKDKTGLIATGKTTQEDFGVVETQMNRLARAASKLAVRGKVVIYNAFLQENPKYDRTLTAAPAFKGKAFPTNAPSYFDYIGLLTTRYDESGNILYPPMVKFKPTPEDVKNCNTSFMCKWSGSNDIDPYGPCDYSYFLRLRDEPMEFKPNLKKGEV